MKYKWLIIINGIEYVYESSEPWTAVREVMKVYNLKRPLAKKMRPDVKKVVKTKGSTYDDIKALESNYIITVTKLGVKKK